MCDFANVTPSSHFIKIQNRLTFLVPAYPGCHGREAIKVVFVHVLNMEGCCEILSPSLCRWHLVVSLSVSRVGIVVIDS